MSKSPKLEIQELGKNFGDAVAVDGLDLKVQRGEFISLLGPSGCGKTTTLNILAGFLNPDRGQVLLDGQVLCDPEKAVPPARRGFAMIFQSYALWPHKTVFENVAYGLRLRKMSGTDVTERVQEVLASVQMDHLHGRYPSELSGGQQQRVALARALVVRPEVLLMDEPLSNLDAGLRDSMRLEIRRLHEEFEMTSIYVTHDQTEAMVMSDRIVVMNGGKREQVGPPGEIYRSPVSPFVAGFIGRMNQVSGFCDGKAVSSPSLSDEVLIQDVTTEHKEIEAEIEVNLGFRPHDAKVRSKGEQEHRSPTAATFLGSISHSTYMGDRHEHEVELIGTGDRRHKVTITDVPDSPSYLRGTEVEVEVETDRLYLLAFKEQNPAT